MITGELRKLAHVFSNVCLDKDWSVTYTTGTSAPSLESVNLEKHIKDIADRIDAEHEREMAERDDERFNALMDARERGVNAVLKEPEGFGLTALPKDADGEFWRYGDRMRLTDGTVVKILGAYGDWIYFFLPTCSALQRAHAHDKRHYHAPTVEDVMVEFATDWESAQEGEDKAAVLKEYAKRLTLAGDAE